MRTPTIGLEIHVELATERKMFCACKNDPLEQHPNINVCPICMGHPGTLPTINEDAVKKVIQFGLALGGTIATQSHFDRKSYFYPDLPKGYQISQYDEPLVEGGTLHDVRITRVHLEEDTGRLQHAEDGSGTLVDYNRASVPLAELVTEPDMHSAEEVSAFAKELQRILRYLGVADADMEKGQMRVEANVSLDMGTKVELKNINSFRAVEQAIAYELTRQNKALDEGETIIQETRGWDEKAQATRSQRSKESAHDYRYFPEPDLPPLQITDMFNIDELRESLPELPAAKRSRFQKEFDLSEEEVNVLIDNRDMAEYFEEAASELKLQAPEVGYKTLYNYFTSDLRGRMNDQKVNFAELKITPNHFAQLVGMVESGALSSKLAKTVLEKMFATGNDPEEIKAEEGLAVIGDEDTLRGVAAEIIADNQSAVDDYRKGKETAIKFLVGQLMAKTRGQADPETAARILSELLSE